MWFQLSSCQLVKFKWIALGETLGMYPNGKKISCHLGPQDLPCGSNSICLISLDEFAIRQPIATQNQFDMWKSDARFFAMIIEDRICKLLCKLKQQVSVHYSSRFWWLTKRKDGTRRRLKSLVFQTAANRRHGMPTATAIHRGHCCLYYKNMETWVRFRIKQKG